MALWHLYYNNACFKTALRFICTAQPRNSSRKHRFRRLREKFGHCCNVSSGGGDMPPPEAPEQSRWALKALLFKAFGFVQQALQQALKRGKRHVPE